MIASVIKLSKALAEVSRKVERRLPPPRGGGGRRLSENSSSVDKLSVPRLSLELRSIGCGCDASKRSECGCLHPRWTTAMPGLGSHKKTESGVK